MVLLKASLAASAIGIALATSLFCQRVQEKPTVAESIDSLMTDLQKRGLFVNGAVIAGKEDKIVFERGFGLANAAENVPFTPDTPSYGASIGKTLTATAILMLQEEGLIHLDDPVTKYLPKFPYPDIKVRHLLEHSSGLLPDGPLLASVPAGEKHTNELLLDLLAKHAPPLAFKPGERFMYSGTGSIVAATIVERVTGKSFVSFVRERIFKPLAMDSSFIHFAEGERKKGVRTIGYRRSPDGKLEPFDVPESKNLYGQGGFDYSTRDLYRWVSSFNSKPLLSKSSLRTGLEPPARGKGKLSGISLLNWYYSESGRRFYFTGDSSGFYSFAYWDADRRHAFAYMSNTLLPNWLRPKLAMAMANILEGRRPAPIEDPQFAIESVPAGSWDLYARLPSAKDFAPIIGEYKMKPAGKVTIENPPPNWNNIGWMLKEGWFAPVVQVDDGQRYNMFPVEPGMFYVPALDAWVGFTESDGKLTLHWTQVHTGTRTGTRMEK
ncbi:MAG: class A beta-lactamase-related serine hydrolase [Acidobacteria bacterium]|nr:MAG: class A beta-lactamase-related serine hydrolase [Acidobacteriota bacterium]REK02111.1 MAG: class A beta-lactamase-related serine hydrolase [Acidobacteriota bacterium]REK14087.1 MAG: class A beta-lactamase-related serine hydrolase [Acidobacteriota bacterium]REK42082.1 MAG: class A beta-lactamase-related serine hydrolase [Acidobacteriota bacterium]